MIELTDYWMGRDKLYAGQWSLVVQTHGKWIVSKVNLLLDIYARNTGIVLTKISSGWRPKTVNDSTSNAAAFSKHITADAVDVEDLDRAFAAWCILHPDQLAACGLWMEDPRWTPTWVHLQDVPPGSGKRVYIPSMSKPKASALPGQKPLPLIVRI